MNYRRAFPVYQPMHAGFEYLIRQNFAAQPMMKTIGATIETVEPGAVAIRLPFAGSCRRQGPKSDQQSTATVGDDAKTR